MRDEQLYAFIAEARARAAAGIRSRTRWLHHQLRADTSFDALCRDLAASEAAVEVSLTSGRRGRGQLAGVGADVLVLRARDGASTYVATRAVVGVRALAPAGDVAGGPGRGGITLRDTHLFVDVLADLADHRDRVTVGTTAPRTHQGILGGVAQDFIWFDGNAHYLRLDTITDVVTGATS